GQILAKEYCLTLANEGPQSVINRIFSAIDHLLSAQYLEEWSLVSTRWLTVNTITLWFSN
ncbi:unnamed protein product, partial [marine sediment metagenome]